MSVTSALVSRRHWRARGVSSCQRRSQVPRRRGPGGIRAGLAVVAQLGGASPPGRQLVLPSQSLYRRWRGGPCRGRAGPEGLPSQSSQAAALGGSADVRCTGRRRRTGRRSRCPLSSSSAARSKVARGSGRVQKTHDAASAWIPVVALTARGAEVLGARVAIVARHMRRRRRKSDRTADQRGRTDAASVITPFLCHVSQLRTNPARLVITLSVAVPVVAVGSHDNAEGRSHRPTVHGSRRRRGERYRPPICAVISGCCGATGRVCRPPPLRLFHRRTGGGERDVIGMDDKSPSLAKRARRQRGAQPVGKDDIPDDRW